MRSRVRIRPYKQCSASARALADYLGAKVLKLENSKFRPRRDDIVINWGNSSTYYGDCIVFNSPLAVAIASNKIKTFQRLDEAGISIPEFCLDRDNVQYLSARMVVVRNTVTGHSGDGIDILPKFTVPSEIPIAPLYTGFIPKKAEYRVIVVDGKAVDIKQKRLSSTAPEDRSPFIRNHANGWVQTRDNIDYVEGLEDIAIDSVEALGLDFGAVDIVVDSHDELFVLEVNTAFGLEGLTIELVGNAIRDMLRR